MGDRDTVVIGGLSVRYLIDASATRGVGLFELTVEAGSFVPPPHSHADNHEVVYGLSGTLRYSVDGEIMARYRLEVAVPAG
ncbi:MAG: hypothetical protein NVS2B3_19520 [Vulcanimicrobiaceae bacterium]